MIMKDINALLPHLRLRFDIEHPSIEESYQFGYESALVDLDVEDNPFREGTASYDHWEEGWWAGFYGEKPLFNIDVIQDEVNPAEAAANDTEYNQDKSTTIRMWLKITGAIAASAIVGYQVIDMVA